MRSTTGMIVKAAFTVLLMPTFLLGAATAMQPSTGTKEDKTVISSSDLAVPMEALFQAPGVSSGKIHYGPPRVELFFGYSYLRAVPSLDPNNRLVWLHGGSTSIAFNLTRHLGIVGDFGGFNDTELNLTGATPSHAADSSGTVFTYLLGPRISFRKYERVTPYVQALFGDIHASDVKLSNCSGGGCTPLPAEDAFALTAGLGLDIKVRRHFAIRLIQAEYLLTRFEDRTTGSTEFQNDMRLSSGIVFRFGGEPSRPNLPVAYTCSVNPSSVFPGETIAATGTASNLNPAKAPVYSWTADGGTVNGGDSSTATISTTSVTAGAYTLHGHVTQGGKPGQSADCTAPYVIKAFEPPTVACSANPSTVIPGGSATITATGVSPQNSSLTYSYGSTSGAVSGTGSTATLSTTGITPGTITVTCNVTDDKGQTASATTPVIVEAPAVAPNPVTSELCSIHFDRDGRRPSRVDNEAKACLDGIALRLQSTSDAKLAIVGNTSTAEKGGSKLASERAVNAKIYLVKEKGIDSSRIAVYSGSRGEKTVSTTLIPDGATFDSTGITPVDESHVKGEPSAHTNRSPN
jgi:outer membrane protein OmpA-like peptidoglycan-associated protein